MRAFIVVLALVATPFLAAVSQIPKEPQLRQRLGDENRSETGQVHAHKGLCATQPPPPDADGDGVPDNLDLCPNTPRHHSGCLRLPGRAPARVREFRGHGDRRRSQARCSWMMG